MTFVTFALSTGLRLWYYHCLRVRLPAWFGGSGYVVFATG
jgi:hypothetical protein